MRIYPPEPGWETPADFPERFGALLIDVVVIVALLFGAVELGILVSGGEEPGGVVSGVLVSAIFLCYSPLATARWGGTLGKRVCRLRVARARDGDPLSYGRALGRHVAHWVLQVLPFGLNHLWFLWDEPLQQCLHDKVAGTVVVRRQR
ncbi:RDD family protein [Streptomyces radicis]